MSKPPADDRIAMPRHLVDLIEDELNYDEDIIWTGRPIPRRFAMRMIPVVCFGIVWTAFALFWIAGASNFRFPDFTQGIDLFPLVGIPFVLIGFALLASPCWMIRTARRTAYLITTKRVIIFDGGLLTTIRSFRPEQLSDLQRRQRPDGTGDLIFERCLSYDKSGDRVTTHYGFFAIAEVKAVEDLVRKLAATASKPGRETDKI